MNIEKCQGYSRRRHDRPVMEKANLLKGLDGDDTINGLAGDDIDYSEPSGERAVLWV